MDVIYTNNFLDPRYHLAGPLNPPKLIGFAPKLDTWSLGMLRVASTNGAAAIIEQSEQYLQGGRDDAGIAVTVTAPEGTTQANSVSESFYASFPTAGIVDEILIFTAELSFDTPQVLDGTEPTWSVGLYFKTNALFDGANDQRSGVDCQFSSDGTVKMHFTTQAYSDINYDYQDFDAYPQGGWPTRFTLTVQLYEGENQAIVGTGSLRYFGATHGPFPLIASGATFNKLAAVGVAMAAISPGIYGARLRSFSISTSLRRL
jgi:hypothetical protein